MELYIESIRHAAEHLFLLDIAKTHNGVSEHLLKKILETVRSIYQYITPEKHKKPIVIFKLVNDNDRVLPEELATRLNNIQSISQNLKNGFIVQHLDCEQILVWQDQSIDIKELAKKGVAYIYLNEVEKFCAEDSIKMVEKFANYPSLWCIPSFRNLNDALNEYSTTQIRYSSCPIFNDTWYDINRLFFKNGPENKIRISLTNFLKIVMRNIAEVRPEQNVDERHPVDIKVTWNTTHRRALIEIKWLGKSRDHDGHITVDYSDARANAGAKQLADYLEMNISQAPIHITQGYLIIIDARRKGLKKDTTSINRDYGCYYQNQEIQFNPKYHEIRTDFEVPIRMFVEPICL